MIRKLNRDKEDFVFTYKARRENYNYFFSARMPTLDEHYKWFIGVDCCTFYIITASPFNVSVGTISCVSGELGHMIIVEPYRNSGYAKDAISDLQLIHDYLKLEVIPENKRAIDLYISMGFILLGANISNSSLVFEWRKHENSINTTTAD